MKIHHKIVSIPLIVAIFAFNLVLLPAQAMEGCNCDHPHGDGEFACFCGDSMKKPLCDTKGPALSKEGHCGLETHADDFCIPAHEHPTLLSTEDTDLISHTSNLQVADSKAFSDTDLLPVEHPPSIL